MKLIKGRVTVEIKDDDKNKELKVDGLKKQGFKVVGKNGKPTEPEQEKAE